MEDELIKRSEAIDAVDEALKRIIVAPVGKDILDRVPTVDGVPVVRCKDCIFWDRKRISCEGLARCATGEGGIRYRSCSDYCSKGKCKDGKDVK